MSVVLLYHHLTPAAAQPCHHLASLAHHRNVAKRGRTCSTTFPAQKTAMDQPLLSLILAYDVVSMNTQREKDTFVPTWLHAPTKDAKRKGRRRRGGGRRRGERRSANPTDVNVTRDCMGGGMFWFERMCVWKGNGSVENSKK